MGLTKQYLRFAPHSVFNVIGSGRGGGVYLRQGVLAVAAVGSVEVCTVPYRTVTYRAVPYRTVLLYCIVLYCTGLGLEDQGKTGQPTAGRWP